MFHVSCAGPMQVQRALKGTVHKIAGFLTDKSKSLQAAFMDARSVVESWRVSDFALGLNVVNSRYVLGNSQHSGVFLDDETMAMALIV